MNQHILQVSHLSLVYKNKNSTRLQALEDINLKVKEGKIVCLIGPSGCGKSSLLSLISGLKLPTSGKVVHRGKKVLGPSSQRVIIFQNYSLFPWKTAIENIEFVLRIKKKTNIAQKAEKYLKLVGLSQFKHCYPHELSGGMQQRIGIARALSCSPDILLFDEPFASLDPITRNSIYSEIISLNRRLKKTMIFVTHNVEEAVYLGDKICVFSPSPGKIIKSFRVNIKKTKSITDLRHLKEYLRLESDIYKLLSGN